MCRLAMEGDDGNGGRGQPECVLKASVMSLDFISQPQGGFGEF